MLVAVKLALTAAVCGLIGWSLSRPDQGIVAEIGAFGPLPGLLVAAGFVAAVWFYCRDLHRLLDAVPPSDRAASPRSVWLMFLIPYNFVEDFWIVGHVAASLARTARHLPALARGPDPFGRIAGFGWCALQILSLVPLPAGSLAGVLALPLWLWHWRRVRQTRQIILSRR